MKAIVLGDGRGRAEPIKEAFSKKKIDATVCRTSNDFMAALCARSFDAAYVNAGTWKKGRSIYEYFGAGSRLESTPIVFYNADETFVAAVAGRPQHENDRVFEQPTDVETVLDSL